jgi:hypothetical protein
MIARALRRLSAAEDGFTIVFALVLLTVGLAVGAAALADTLATRSHANLDQRQRRALQAADFGVQAVLYRVNQLNLDSLDLTGGASMKGKLPVCVVHKSNGEWATETPTGGGACPKVTEEIGNHASYQAEFVPNENVPTGGSGINFIEPKIVAIGIDENANTAVNAKGEFVDPNHKVYARVDAGLSPVEPFKTVEANHDLTFRVPLAEVFNGTARAGHNVHFKGESALANIFTGLNITLGGKFVSAPTIEYGCEVEKEKGLLGPNVIVIPESMLVHVTEGKEPCKEAYFRRPPISISGSKVNCTSGCAGLAGYESEGDNIRIEKGETLTLTSGNDYVFCSLWTNGPITLAAGTSNESLPVRVFIDNPSSTRCKGFKEYKTKTKPEEAVKAGSFYAGLGVGGLVGGFAQTLSPSQVQIYLVGNGTNDETSFTSTSGASNAFFLYAPQSLVNVSAFTFGGTLLGYDTTIYATVYTQDLGLNNYPLSNSYGVFHIAGYTQCTQKITELSSNAATDLSGC